MLPRLVEVLKHPVSDAVGQYSSNSAKLVSPRDSRQRRRACSSVSAAIVAWHLWRPCSGQACSSSFDLTGQVEVKPEERMIGEMPDLRGLGSLRMARPQGRAPERSGQACSASSSMSIPALNWCQMLVRPLASIPGPPCTPAPPQVSRYRPAHGAAHRGRAADYGTPCRGRRVEGWAATGAVCLLGAVVRPPGPRRGHISEGRNFPAGCANLPALWVLYCGQGRAMHAAATTPGGHAPPFSPSVGVTPPHAPQLAFL